MTTVLLSKSFVPGVEFVTVNGSAGDTYVSQKFKLVDGGIATFNAAVTSTTTDNMTLAVVPSTTNGTVTIAGRNFTNTNISLVLWGRRYNK